MVAILHSSSKEWRTDRIVVVAVAYRVNLFWVTVRLGPTQDNKALHVDPG